MDAEKKASGQKTPNWDYYEANFLVEIWADEKYNVSYQRWEESTIHAKTSPQSPITTVTSVQHRNAKPKFTTWNKSTKMQKIWTKPAKNERSCDSNFKLHSAADV